LSGVEFTGDRRHRVAVRLIAHAGTTGDGQRNVAVVSVHEFNPRGMTQRRVNQPSALGALDASGTGEQNANGGSERAVRIRRPDGRGELRGRRLGPGGGRVTVSECVEARQLGDLAWAEGRQRNPFEEFVVVRNRAGEGRADNARLLPRVTQVGQRARERRIGRSVCKAGEDTDDCEQGGNGSAGKPRKRMGQHVEKYDESVAE
jgi:hypothetical protein